MNRTQPARPTRGFTLVEMLAVLAVLAILAMGVLPLAQLAQQRQKEQALQHALWEIREALDTFKRAADQGLLSQGVAPSGYPVSLEVLIQAQRDTQGRWQRFLRQVPRDPFADEGLSAAQGWALRSYASEDNAPRPGGDVYDVHSRSPVVGSNGVPVAQW